MPELIKKTDTPPAGNTYWENHLISWEKSGLSKAEYCRQKNISYYAFHYWRKRLKISRSSASITLVQLEEETKKVTSSFTQRSVSPQSQIRFWVNGFCIEVGNNFSPTTMSQWPRLTRYLDNGLVRMDNNLVENAIRPFVIGRKNWMFSVSPKGAEASATFYSLIETARANGLEPSKYLRYLFEKFPYAQTPEDVFNLLPMNVLIEDMEVLKSPGENNT